MYVVLEALKNVHYMNVEVKLYQWKFYVHRSIYVLLEVLKILIYISK